jgi:hypothetical protein
MSHTQTLVIESSKRLRNSVNGNPRFEITFTDGSRVRTSADSMSAYDVENSEYRGVPLRVEFTPAGNFITKLTII